MIRWMTFVSVREFRWYRGRRIYSGWYWSATTGGLVAYESRLELARIILADFDPEVVRIAARPFQLSWPRRRGPARAAGPPGSPRQDTLAGDR